MHPKVSSRVLTCQINVSSIGTLENKGTQLDSHAIMVVGGKFCEVISKSGMTEEVSGFTQDIGILSKVPLIDAALAYDCPVEGNLIPPFIMREANLIVNDVPKQHCDQLTNDSHTIQDLTAGLKIQLKLEGIFSGFCTRKPTEEEMMNGIVIPITPEGISWDPNSLHSAHNEDTMVDE